MLIDRADLDVVDALDVGEIAADSRIGERTGLDDGFVLDWTEVGERVGAGVVVVGVAADKCAEVEDGVHADGAGVGGGNVVGEDFGALVGVADGPEDRTAAGAAREYVLHPEVVVRIRRLEPRAAEAEVQVDRVRRRELAIDAIEDVEFVTLVVEHGELWRIEEPTRFEAIALNEIAPVLPAVAEVGGAGGGTEGAKGGGDGAGGRSDALTGARGDLNDEAGLAAVLGWWSAGDDFERLNRVRRKLVGEDLALLVRDGLSVDGKRVRGMVAEAVKKAVRVGRG